MTFFVAQMRDSSRNRVIGWQVVSQSNYGGLRHHLASYAMHESSLARAKAEMEVEAARLNAEAAANRARASVA